jgi:hypothetical protein
MGECCSLRFLRTTYAQAMTVVACETTIFHDVKVGLPTSQVDTIPTLRQPVFECLPVAGLSLPMTARSDYPTKSIDLAMGAGCVVLPYRPFEPQDDPSIAPLDRFYAGQKIVVWSKHPLKEFCPETVATR